MVAGLLGEVIMSRTARALAGGICYHVLNRGNAKAQIFRKTADYDVFLLLVAQACERMPMRILSYCLMPNHFHFALWPEEDGQISKWMHWLMSSHVRRYRDHYQTTGHIWQGRYKAFPVQEDGHFLTVARYVERNPLRANLVQRAENWPWSSLNDFTKSKKQSLLADWPVPRPDDWIERVNHPESNAELEAVRNSVNRGMPYGSLDWIMHVAGSTGFEYPTHPRGRPRKK
jgi:putative transposase